MRTHLAGQSGAEVFLGDAPSFRRAEENDALLDRYRTEDRSAMTVP